MGKRSAGLVMYRRRGDQVQVLLIHPGGPLWMGKDVGAWSIPKGEYAPHEAPLTAAKREFKEETGLEPGEPVIDLGSVRQPGGKVVQAWAFEGDCDPATVKSNTFSQEWPPHSGRTQDFPEVDRAEWFVMEEAVRRIMKGQVTLLTTLQRKLWPGPGSS